MNCIRCNGTGTETFEEDYRIQSHICYHCNGAGKVDDEMAFYDKLSQVALTLAYHHVCEMKQYADSDPYEEGWNFHAAENMMSSKDYFDMKVYDFAGNFSNQLFELPLETQQVLIAWNESAN